MKKLLTIIFLSLFSLLLNGQGIWTQKASISYSRDDAFSFSIGNKGYVGGGVHQDSISSQQYLSDFWEYDPTLNSWTQIANFGGGVRAGGIGFSIGNKGYAGMGLNNITYLPLKDFWEYDPTLNTWTSKTDYGGGNIIYPVGFSIGNKGYVGTGADSIAARNDFWEYNPAINTWTQKTNFSGIARWCAVGFSIGNKGYIGTGIGATNPFTDFWEYDTTLNSWTQKANVGGVSRWLASAFSISNKGYIGIGLDSSNYYLNDFWEYNPSIDQWLQKANYPGNGWEEGQFFSIGNKGYFGMGGNPITFSDFWEYTPDISISIEEINNSTNIIIYPNPFTSQTTIKFSEEQKNTTIRIIDLLGKEIKTINFTGRQLVIDKGEMQEGIYFVQTIDEKKNVINKKIIIQ